MKRHRIEVSQPVKSKFTQIKKIHRFTTETEAAAFLLALYEKVLEKGDIPMKEYSKLKERAQEIDRQQILL
ncbi:hypothetical protein [Paenibacillus hubeiensis]|uniref:hypothetical protein n=1 Tax=Paenibacillus hubeiensis TaxID=3077330 RepID=UPI0031BB23D0